MADSFKLEIITPGGVVFEGNAKHVRAPGVEGSFGVLKGHTPFITTLEMGEIVAALEEKKSAVFATSGGLSEVHGNHMIVLAETAEEQSKIDVDRAISARDRARQRLESKEPDVDVERARAALARSINRIRVAANS